MNSIRKKIQRTIVGSILFVSFFAVLVLLVGQLNAYRNQQIIETMVMEYSIVADTNDLISTYNDVVKNPGNEKFSTHYALVHEKLLTTLSLLKNRIESQESKVLLVGIENIVKKVLQECDQGLMEVKNNSFENFSEHFALAHKYNEFVRLNTNELIEKELGYLSLTQKETQRTSIVILASSLALFVCIILIVIARARSFSIQLLEPIEHLTAITKQVADGNMDVPIAQNLLEQKDETGTLSKSIATMIATIQTTISKLNASKNAFETKNVELEKLNKFMVGRELKMAELKKEIETLKQKT